MQPRRDVWQTSRRAAHVVAARHPAAAALAVTACLIAGGCARALTRTAVPANQPAVIGELWQDPLDLERRDLYYGPGGPGLAPLDTPYELIARDTSGFSPGFQVADANGTRWSVKVGPEAQSEVLASRVLWAIGFHQPPTYYVPRWSLAGADGGVQPAGRFRPELPDLEDAGGWSWYENPFVGSAPFRGLIVANLVLNSWDWKTSNNSIYTLREPRGGVRRWFVVRDVGAALGRTTYPTLLRWLRLRGLGQGTRNDVEDFETQDLIRRVDGGSRVVFDYRGIYGDVIATVTAADVIWTCRLLDRLSDAQWQDAFRAAGYDRILTERFVAKIEAKVTQGLALERTMAAQ
jgi:hypothetical protein